MENVNQFLRWEANSTKVLNRKISWSQSCNMTTLVSTVYCDRSWEGSPSNNLVIVANVSKILNGKHHQSLLIDLLINSARVFETLFIVTFNSLFLEYPLPSLANTCPTLDYSRSICSLCCCSGLSSNKLLFNITTFTIIDIYDPRQIQLFSLYGENIIPFQLYECVIFLNHKN